MTAGHRLAVPLLVLLGAVIARGQERDALLERLRQGAPEQRAEAARILGESRDAALLEPLLAALRDPDAGVRAAVAEALMRQRSPRAAMALAAALDDPDPDVRRAAGRALRARGPRRGPHVDNGAPGGARSGPGPRPPRESTEPSEPPDITSGFEEVPSGAHPRDLGWATYLKGGSAGVTDAVAHDGKHSFRIESEPLRPRCEALTLPLDLDRVTCEIAVLVDPVPGRWVRVGFMAPAPPNPREERPGRVRAFNHFRIDSGKGDLAEVTFRGTGREPVMVGSAPKAEWILLRVDYDFRTGVADLWLGGKRVVEGTPLRPRRFPTARDRIAMRQWGVAQGRWRGGSPGVVHVDDVRVHVPTLTAEQRARSRERWMEQLADSDRRKRAQALVELGRLGGDGVYRLILDRVRDDDSVVRFAAVTALGKLGDERAVGPLLAILGGEEPSLHKPAATALVRFGERALPGLVDLFDRRPSPGTRVATALASFGAKSVEAVRSLVTDDRPGARCAAAWVLGRTADSSATEPLLALAEDDDSAVRQEALDALARIPDERALAAVHERLTSEDPEDRAAAVRALRLDTGPRGQDLVEPLLRDPSFTVRQAAAWTLEAFEDWLPTSRNDWAWFLVGQARFGQAAELGTPGLDPLIAAIRDGDFRTQLAALQVLPRIGRSAIGPLLALRDVVRPELRPMIARTLEDLGWKPGSEKETAWHLIDARRWDDLVALGSTGIEPLATALRSRNGEVREGAARTLDRLGWSPADDEQRAYHLAAHGKVHEAAALGAVAIEPLCLALVGGGAHSSLPAHAAAALGELGDRRAVEPLCEALRSAPMDGQQEAALALAKLGDRRAVEPLIAALRDRELRVHAYAAVALGELGDPRALEALERCHAATSEVAEAKLEDVRKNPKAVAFFVYGRSFRCSIAAAMFRLGREEMMPAVVRALDDDLPAVRLWAARMIGRLGPDAESAIPGLVRMERRGEPGLARAAFRALRAVRPRVHVDSVVLRDGIRGPPFLTFRKGMSWTYAIQGPKAREVGRITVREVYEDGRIEMACDLPDGLPLDDAGYWRAKGNVLEWEMESLGYLACVIPGGKIGVGWASRLFGLRCASKNVGIEAVEVPAGKFASCLRVEHDFKNAPVFLTQWWAKGVGLVKLELAKRKSGNEKVVWALTSTAPR